MKKLILTLFTCLLLIPSLAFGAGVTDKSLGGIIDILEAGALTEMWVGGGAGNVPVATTVTGTGAPVLATTPTLVTPEIGAATGTSLDLGATSLFATRSLTVDTGGVFNVALSAAAGDDFTVDTTKLVVSGDTGEVGIGLNPTARNNTVLQIKDGIGFPATAVASSDANTLDSYEEGTWNVSITFGGAAVSVTYGSQLCIYTKIGNRVFVSGRLTLTNNGSSSGAAVLTGLPFTVDGGAAYESPTSLWLNHISFADFPIGRITQAGTTIQLWEITNAGVLTVLDENNVPDNGDVMFNGSYSSLQGDAS